MKNTTLALYMAALAFVSCQNSESTDPVTAPASVADTAVITDMHTSKISLDWSGMYEGTLPCADCPGIKTTIELKGDNTFTQNLEYLDRNSRFNDTGKIEWHENGNNITLISKTGEKQQFKVKEGSLVMLNADGKESTGSLAGHYILNKLD